ncbi:MAG: nitroreductase family protein [Spirochaetota bacterium]
MNSIFKRRSIRKYTPDAVSDSDIEDILRAGMAAPSAGNQQPWHFIVIRDRALLDEIPNINPYSKLLENAPAAILVCGDTRLEKHEGFWVQDCSAATENMLIEIASKGLGGVWLGFYPRKERIDGIKKLFGLPKEVFPLAVVALGHPAEKPEPADRFKKERIHYDTW